MNAVRRSISNVAFVWEKNRTRLILLLALVTFLVILNGSRGLLSGVTGFLASAPFLAVQLLFAITFMIIQFGALFWFLSRPRKYTVTPDDSQIGLSFENYRGQPDLLEHAKSTVKILQGLSNFEKLGGDMPKGMLLTGRPGTGKTFLAGCIAAEAGLPFIYIDASSLRGMFIGMDTLMVMKLFRDARGLGRKYAHDGKRGACIMFMDELDSIGMSRSGQAGAPVGGMGMGMFGGGGAGLNTLLNQMDSLGDHVEDRWRVKVMRWFGLVRGPVPQKPLIFVIGATNRPDVLDPALTRPGRLDRMLHVYSPDGEGRRDIISHYLSKKAHDPAMDIDFMVADSIGWTPVMIKTIINEALVVAHDDGRDYLTYKDWLAAADSRVLGLKQPIRGESEEDRRATAYHEAGHAVVAHYLKPEDRIIKASIIRAGDALGVVQWSAKEERQHKHARQLETDIMVGLGSRAVEEIFLDTKMTGASSDLMGASSAALAYCAYFGMGNGLLVMPSSGNLSYPMPIARMAESLLQTLMTETKRLVTEKEYAVHAVAAALLDRGELIGEELEAVFDAADAANTEAAAPFERKLFTLPRLFEERGPIIDGSQAWPGEGAEAAAASGGGGVPVPGDAALHPGTVDPDRGPTIDQRGDWPST